jgi:hypothetical protein
MANAAEISNPTNETPKRTAPSLYPQKPAIAKRMAANIQMSMAGE